MAKMRFEIWWLAVATLVLFGCQDDGGSTARDTAPGPDAATSDVASPDIRSDDASAGSDAADTSRGDADARDADTADADSLPSPGGTSPLPPSSVLGERRDLQVTRGIVHSHTPHSHDACDGDPRRDDGSLNESCLQDWREGVCATRLDVVFNSDHDEFVATEPFRDLLLERDGDEIVYDDDRPVANRIDCGDGESVMLLPGGEFGVMPVGLRRHLDAPPDERADIYGEKTAERVDSFRDAGAVVLQAHTESESLETLRDLQLDGFEIYNLHANVAPDIREEHLGLDPAGFVEQLNPFLEDHGPHPDLAMIAFFEPNAPALEKFDTLLAEGHRLVGTAGNDAHQNALPFELRDGERADSFRRMMKFFTTHLLVDDPTPAGFRDALREGRAYTAFEYLGTPVGFDFRADTAEATVEMGETASLSEDPELRVGAPEVYAVPEADAPTVELIRAEPDGGTPVAETTGDLAHTPTEPGAYRAVVRLRPDYLRPYLGSDPETYLDEPLVWIYSNPIYVEE